MDDVMEFFDSMLMSFMSIAVLEIFTVVCLVLFSVFGLLMIFRRKFLWAWRLSFWLILIALNLSCMNFRFLKLAFSGEPFGGIPAVSVMCLQLSWFFLLIASGFAFVVPLKKEEEPAQVIVYSRGHASSPEPVSKPAETKKSDDDVNVIIYR